MKCKLLLSLATVVVLLAASAGGSELEVEFGGAIQSDFRLRMDDRSVGPFYARHEWKPGVDRNENRLEFKFQARYGDARLVSELRAAWFGFLDGPVGIGELANRNTVDPYYLEARAAFLEVNDLVVDGLDLRIGQQLVLWGVGDQFNPTNNINANDIEDILLFGDQRANFMIRADYNFLEQFSLSAVLVPVFQGAQLPRSSTMATAMIDRVPIVEEGLRHKIEFENTITAARYRFLGIDIPATPAVVSAATVELPERSFDNMPFAFRLAGNVFGQDVALSYYRGRHDFPLPLSNHASQRMFGSPICDPASGAGSDEFDPSLPCIDGVIDTDVVMGYPRVQVIGFNMAGELPLDWIDAELLGIGYRVEFGLYLPDPVEYRVTQDTIFEGHPVLEQPAGEYDYGLGGARPHVVDGRAFAKWVVGLDYSFGPHWMVNLMWVHGMVDEFGAGDFLRKGYQVRQSRSLAESPYDCLFSNLDISDPQGISKATEACAERNMEEILRPRIGDYAVAGVDFKFADQAALVRLFVIWDVSGYYRSYFDEQAGRRVMKYLDLFGDGFSMIVYPEINYNFGNGLELGLGALLQLGNRYTKFGDPAAGGSVIWTRARFSF